MSVFTPISTRVLTPTTIRVTGVQDSYAAYARTLVSSGHKKLKVVFGGNPATDGKTLWLPQMPYDLNEEDLFLVRSDIMHECGHLEDSDFEYFKEFGIKHGGLAQRVLNAIEDVRIEVAQARRHRGGEMIIRKSMVIMIRRGKARTGRESAAEALMTLCYVYGCVLRGWDGEILETSNKAQQYLIDHLGKGSEHLVSVILDTLKDGYGRLRSTQDAGELTLKVLEIFKTSQTPQNQGNSSEQSKDEGEGQKSESSGKGEKSEKADSGENKPGSDSKEDGNSNSNEKGEQSGTNSNGNSKGLEDGEKQPGSGEGAEAGKNGNTKSSDKGDSSGAKATSGEGSTLSQKIEEMLKTDPGEREVVDLRMEVIELAENIRQGKLPEYRGKPLVPKSCDASSGVSAYAVEGIEKVRPDRATYRQLEQRIGSRAGVLLSTLQMLLQTQVEEEVEITTRGRIAPGKLYRAGLDDNRIFSRVHETNLPRAAVTVLTDLSSSMRGPRITLALQTLILMEKAMSLVGNATEYLGFGSRNNKALTIAKEFDDDPIVGKAGIGGLTKHVGGGTPLLEGLFEAVMRLISRQEKRKFLFVLTDGDPANPNECREASLRAQASGIDVVYFLIGMKAPQWLKDTSFQVVEIPSDDELVHALMIKFKEMILN